MTVAFDPVASFDNAVTNHKLTQAAREAARKAKAQEVKAAFEPLVRAIETLLAQRKPHVNNYHFYPENPTIPAKLQGQGFYHHDMNPRVKINFPTLGTGDSSYLFWEYDIQSRKYCVWVLNRNQERQFDHWIPAYEHGVKLLAPFVVENHQP